MGDGEIEPTFRWRQQLQGAHAGEDEHNQHGIGIAVVGNFESGAPSAAQIAAVRRLTHVLRVRYDIQPTNIIRHSEIKATACPGKYFPMDEIAQRHRDPLLGANEPNDDNLRVAGKASGNLLRVAAEERNHP
jgi:N-acetyl-anhydromuramyl-L-alanine amidase AmpD